MNSWRLVSEWQNYQKTVDIGKSSVNQHTLWSVKQEYDKKQTTSTAFIQLPMEDNITSKILS